MGRELQAVLAQMFLILLLQIETVSSKIKALRDIIASQAQHSTTEIERRSMPCRSFVRSSDRPTCSRKLAQYVLEKAAADVLLAKSSLLKLGHLSSASDTIFQPALIGGYLAGISKALYRVVRVATPWYNIVETGQ